MLKKTLRQENIVRELSGNPLYNIHDLAVRYGVSDMTIRRDIRSIEQRHLMSMPASAYQSSPQLHEQSAESSGKRLSGGDAGTESISSENNDLSFAPGGDYDFDKALVTFAEEKKRIAQAALTMIEPDDVIILDTGSTVDMLAAMIPYDMPLTVICYSYNIFDHLRGHSNIHIVMAGGYYHQTSRSFESSENIDLLKRLRASKIFISTSGVERNGLTCSSQYEVITKQAALGSALKKILVADSSKFGIVKTSFFASINSMDTLICDTGLSPEWVDFLKGQNIDLRLV